MLSRLGVVMATRNPLTLKKKTVDPRRKRVSGSKERAAEQLRLEPRLRAKRTSSPVSTTRTRTGKWSKELRLRREVPSRTKVFKT